MNSIEKARKRYYYTGMAGYFLSGIQHILRIKSPFAFFPCDIYLQENPNRLILFCSFFLDLFSQGYRINRMNQSRMSDQVFYLIFLQMSDHMPLDRTDFIHMMIFLDFLH